MRWFLLTLSILCWNQLTIPKNWRPLVQPHKPVSLGGTAVDLDDHRGRGTVAPIGHSYCQGALQEFFLFPSVKLGVVGLDPLTLQHLLKGVVVDRLGLLHEFP